MLPSSDIIPIHVLLPLGLMTSAAESQDHENEVAAGRYPESL